MGWVVEFHQKAEKEVADFCWVRRMICFRKEQGWFVVSASATHTARKFDEMFH